MRNTRISRQEKKKIKENKVSVLIIDDDSRVRDSIKINAEIKGYTGFLFAADGNQASKLIDEGKHFEIISADYDLSEESFDGVGLIKFLLPVCSTKPLGCIIYSDKTNLIKKEEELWCNEVGIKIKTKSANHENLFETIESILDKPSHLPENPKYANMKNEELLITLANDLLKELSANKDSKFSFGSDTNPMKNSDIIKEIKNLSPLGKEIIGTWFSGVKRNLDFLHRDRLRVKKD